MNNWAYAAFMGVGLAIIAAVAAGYFYLRSESSKEKAAVEQAVHSFLSSWAAGELESAYSALCSEQIGDFTTNRARITKGLEGYDGHDEFRGELNMPLRGTRTLEYALTTHFSDGTDGWLYGASEKRDGAWCIVGIEYSPRELATPVVAATQSPTEPSDGQSIQVEWFETDGGCNPRRPLSGSVSGVEFLALRIRATGFGVAEKAVVEIFRNGESMRSTTKPIVVPPVGETTSLCLYGPVLGQSAGGWPAGLYQVEFRLVGGANVGSGHLRID